MPYGTVDVFTSRRDYFLSCEYWIVSKERLSEKNQIVHDEMPTGNFDAKFDSQISEGNQTIGQSFLFATSETTIVTQDDISDIKKNSLVRFWDLVWRVEEIGKRPIKNNYQLDNKISFEYFLELKR